MTTVATPADLLGLAGAHLGPTGWETLDDERIQQFAAATGTPAPDAAVPPMLVLSLVNQFLPELLTVQRFSAGLNVGLDEVCFSEPVASGSRLRGRGEVLSAQEVKGGVQIVIRVDIDCEGVDAPACTADTVSRFLP